MKPTITTHNHAPATLEQVEQLAMDRAEYDAFEVAQTFANCRKPPLTDAQKLADKLVACQKQADLDRRAAVAHQLNLEYMPHKTQAEAVATATNQPVVDALCAQCGQPTAQWVVAQNAAVIQELNEELMVRGRKIRLLEADKAVLTTENEKLNRELMHPDRNGDEDGFWWFVLHLLALIAVFGLGWAVGGAV